MSRLSVKLSANALEVQNKFQRLFHNSKLIRGRLRSRCCYKIVIPIVYSPKPNYFGVEEYPIFATRSLVNRWESNPFLPVYITQKIQKLELEGKLIRLDNKPSKLFPQDKPPFKSKALMEQWNA